MLVTELGRWKNRAVKGLRGTRGKSYPLLPPGSTYPLDWRPHASIVSTPAQGVRAPSETGDRSDYLHPVATSFAGLALHQRMLLDGADVGEPILALARALCGAQEPHGAWTYPVAVPYYGRAPGWVSGMAQGLALSFLLRAAPLAASDEEATLIESAVVGAHAALLRPLRDNGCTDWDSQGRPFFEECPATPPPFILNGAVFAIVGLHDYEAARGGDVSARAAVRLSEMLPSWDLGYWSSYDATRRAPSSPDYHQLHVSQLVLMHRLFPEFSFGRFAETFSAYSHSRRNRNHAFLSVVVSRCRDALGTRSFA